MAFDPIKIKGTFTGDKGFVEERTPGEPKVIFKVPVCVSGGLFVSGTLNTDGPINVTGSLNVTGSATITGSLDVSCSLTVAGVPVLTNPVVRTMTETGPMLATDDVLLLSSSVAVITVNLVAAASYDRKLYVKRIDGTIHQIILNPAGSERIDGELTEILQTQWTGLTLINNDTDWFIF